MNLSHEDAEDIAQNSLVKLWDKMPEFKKGFRTGAFRAWLCRIVKNQALNLIKRQQNLNRKLEQLCIKIESMESPELESIAQKEWDVYLANLAWKEVEKECNQNLRQCFKLSMKDLSPKDIAEKLGIPKSSVLVYRKRVKDRLKEKIISLQDQYL
ncbi:MAG: RNA polymerase sigma factor [Lentisphaeraceae bacterium]|nr:RNA polymerase sigma factor [Lentisphaeraceae bacterium]